MPSIFVGRVVSHFRSLHTPIPRGSRSRVHAQAQPQRPVRPAGAPRRPRQLRRRQRPHAAGVRQRLPFLGSEAHGTRSAHRHRPRQRRTGESRRRAPDRGGQPRGGAHRRRSAPRADDLVRGGGTAGNGGEGGDLAARHDLEVAARLALDHGGPRAAGTRIHARGRGRDQRREAGAASPGAGGQARHGAHGGGPDRGLSGVCGGGEPARARRQRPGDRRDGDALAAEGRGGAAPPGAALSRTLPRRWSG